MVTKKDYLKIALYALAGILVACGLTWLICELAPLLLGIIIFIPWLGVALADGANV